MTRRVGNLILLFLLFSVAVFFYTTYNPEKEGKLKTILSNINHSIRFVPQIDSTLTEEGVILWTNIERQNENLSLLLVDDELNLVAQKRLENMFSEQYFSHYSPNTNRGAEDEAKDLNYQFISIGENIAKGDFKNDKALVTAWMESPEHRENILKDKYTRIGVAVGKEIFEGQKTWLAVQIFAKPMTDCFEPAKDLKLALEKKRGDLESLIFQSEQLLKEMSEDSRDGRIEAYNQKVPIYNALINEIKVKEGKLDRLITSYNNQVRSFNLCIQG